MNDKMRAAMNATFEKLMAMPREEFLKEFEKQSEGDIAKILMYSGAFTKTLDNLIDSETGKPIEVEIETLGQARSFIEACRAGREDGERLKEMFGDKSE